MVWMEWPSRQLLRVTYRQPTARNYRAARHTFPFSFGIYKRTGQLHRSSSPLRPSTSREGTMDWSAWQYYDDIFSCSYLNICWHWRKSPRKHGGVEAWRHGAVRQSSRIYYTTKNNSPRTTFHHTTTSSPGWRDLGGWEEMARQPWIRRTRDHDDVLLLVVAPCCCCSNTPPFFHDRNTHPVLYFVDRCLTTGQRMTGQGQGKKKSRTQDWILSCPTRQDGEGLESRRTCHVFATCQHLTSCVFFLFIGPSFLLFSRASTRRTWSQQ